MRLIRSHLLSQVGGLPTQELNKLELQFLLLNDFRLAIPPEELQHYFEQLLTDGGDAFSKSHPGPTSPALELFGDAAYTFKMPTRLPSSPAVSPSSLMSASPKPQPAPLHNFQQHQHTYQFETYTPSDIEYLLRVPAERPYQRTRPASLR